LPRLQFQKENDVGIGLRLQRFATFGKPRKAASTSPNPYDGAGPIAIRQRPLARAGFAKKLIGYSGASLLKRAKANMFRPATESSSLRGAGVSR